MSSDSDALFPDMNELEEVRGKHPRENKFHVGNGDDGKHYWLTPPELHEALNAEFTFDFDPCPFPLPAGFDGLTCDWGRSNYVNPPFGSIIHQGRKKGPTAWVRKALSEQQKGNRTVLVYPIDKWILMLLAAGAQVRNLGDVRWLATEDGSQGKGTGRHIACFILDPPPMTKTDEARARPLSEWREEDGDVLWWKFPINEPPFVGSPLTQGQRTDVLLRVDGQTKYAGGRRIGAWPGYHTHWTPIPLPGDQT